MTYRWPLVVGHASYALRSVDPGSSIAYAVGYYKHGATANDFNPAITFGTADSCYGARMFFVSAGGGAGDTVITVTGTSISDAGVRTPADSEAVTIAAGEPVNTMHQTLKRWLGQVTITKTAGVDILCNYGFVAFWAELSIVFVFTAIDVFWQGDGTDAGVDIKVFHHKTSGWTYHAAAPADPPLLMSMGVDCAPERSVVNDEEGRWRRSGMQITINGALREGLVVAGIQTGSTPFGSGTVVISSEPPP